MAHSGCFRPGRPEVNCVVLVSIDTCRADHLGCYGDARGLTPQVDAIAREGLLFTQVLSTAPMTLPSHCSLLTGMIPPDHGVRDNFDYRLAESRITLAEILKEHGYRTAAFVGAFVLDRQFGLGQGFDVYNDQFAESRESINPNPERKAEVISRLAREWLRENRAEKFFLFLHYYDPHIVYEPPEPFASRFPDDPYAGEIAYTDHSVGQVIDDLKELGLYDRALIVITGDHGESLGEHGEQTHAYFIYQSTQRIPLVIKRPGRTEPGVYTDRASIIDIMPTILGYLGIEAPEEAKGEDLSDRGASAGRLKEKRALYCESLTPTKYDCNPLFGAVSGRWKYILSTKPELYDLESNPQETVNLVEEKPEQARLMRERLEEIGRQQGPTDPEDSHLSLDQESLRSLEALGYVAGRPVRPAFDLGSTQRDPKDFVQVYEAVVGAERHVSQGTALAKQGKFEEALRQYIEALQIHPELASGHYNLANILARQGKAQEAIVHYLEALRIQPDHAEAHNNLGNVLLSLRRNEEAIEHYQKALEINPNHRAARANLATALARRAKGR